VANVNVKHVIMREKITDIVLKYTNKEITSKDAIDELCDLHNVSISFDMESIKNAQQSLHNKMSINENDGSGYFEAQGGSRKDVNGIDETGFPSY